MRYDSFERGEDSVHKALKWLGGIRHSGRRLIGLGTVATISSICLAACGGEDAGNSGGAAGGNGDDDAVKTIVMNNFMGNSWRPVMMRSAQLLAKEGPLAGRIGEPKLVVTENSASAQNTALNSALLEKPKLILIDAANATASNQAIEKVCAEGVTVVSFDVLVTAPCAWKISIDFEDMGATMARWMVKQVDGEGTVFLDEGQAGAASAASFAKGARSVLGKHPGISVKRYFGEFSPGAEQAAVANLVSANPDVKGILGFAYGAPALEALKKAGKDPVPTTGFSYNEGLLYCQQNKVPCLFKSSPTWVSGEAMRLGLDVIDGKKTGKPGVQLLTSPYFVSGDVKPETSDPVEEIDAAAQPNLNPGIMLPLSPGWAELDPKAVLTPPDVG